MNLFKTFSALVAGFAITTAPALARVDAGTPSLIRSLDRYGVNVGLNHPDCQGQTQFAGYYNTQNRDFVVCYSGVPTANDHDTVRHEAMHVAQHCAAQREGRQYGIRPILRGADLNEFVTSVLTDRQIVSIKSAYPREKWLTELEAFAAAQHYTAAQMESIVRTWCSR